MDGNEAPHLEDPPAVVNATLEYRSDSDRIAHFIEENFVEDAKGAISTQTAYAMYKTWCAENGYRPGNQGAFSKALKGYDKIRIERPYINGKQQMCIIGYSLKQGAELEKSAVPGPTYAINTQPDDETS